MHAYTYVHVRIYVCEASLHVPTFIYVCVCTSVHVYRAPYANVCLHASGTARVCACTYVHVRVYAFRSWFARAFTPVFIRAYVRVQQGVHLYVCGHLTSSICKCGYVCVCVAVCVSLRVHVCMGTRVFAEVGLRVYLCLVSRVCVCPSVCVHTSVHLGNSMCKCVHACVYDCMYTDACAHTRPPRVCRGV